MRFHSHSISSDLPSIVSHGEADSELSLFTGYKIWNY